MVGEVLRRHAHLERTFGRLLGEEALQASKATVWTNQSLGAELNQVQNGVLFGLPAAGDVGRRTRSRPPESDELEERLDELDLGEESDSDGDDDAEEGADVDSHQTDDDGSAELRAASDRARSAEQAIQSLMQRGFTREQAIQRLRVAAFQSTARQ